MNRDRNVRRSKRTAKDDKRIAGIDADDITSMVTAGKPNPFLSGSREHIAFAWTEELARHAASDQSTELTARARRILPQAAATRRRAVRAVSDTSTKQPASRTPPIPTARPEQPADDAIPTSAPPMPTTKPVPPKVPIVDIWDHGELFAVSRRFADEIDRVENSHNEWDKVSPTGALGRYQLRWPALTDIGLMLDRNTWKLGGLPNREEFLNDPLLQNLAFSAYLKTMQRYLVDNGSTDFVGQTIIGKKDTFDVTESGLLAAAHRYGQGNVRAYLRHQAENKWTTDENTFGAMKKIFLAIETRLREFSDVPLRASPSAPPLINREMLQ